MKGERILAELLSIVGLTIYVIAWQHLMAEMMHEPERSWVNQVRGWWVTRHSRRRVVELRKIWDSIVEADEPTPQKD